MTAMSSEEHADFDYTIKKSRYYTNNVMKKLFQLPLFFIFYDKKIMVAFDMKLCNCMYKYVQ